MVSVKRARANTKSSGGIAVFVKQNLIGEVNVANTSSTTDTVWIKLKKEFFKESSDIFVGTVYFSPENYERKYNKDYISQVEHEITYFKSKGEVIIQGDFNARVEQNKIKLPIVSTLTKTTILQTLIPTQYMRIQGILMITLQTLEE